MCAASSSRPPSAAASTTTPALCSSCTIRARLLPAAGQGATAWLDAYVGDPDYLVHRVLVYPGDPNLDAHTYDLEHGYAVMANTDPAPGQPWADRVCQRCYHTWNA